MCLKESDTIFLKIALGIFAVFFPLASCFAGSMESKQLRVHNEAGRIVSLRNLLTGKVLRESIGNVKVGVEIWRGKGSVFTPTPVLLNAKSLDDGSMEIRASVKDKLAKVRRVWTTLGPFDSEQVCVVTTAWDGCVIDQQAEEWSYRVEHPSFWFPLPLLLLHTDKGGICVWPMGDDNYVAVEILRSQQSISVALGSDVPPLSSSRTARVTPWRLVPYAGDWQNGADKYAAWLESERGFVPLAKRKPRWLSQITGVIKLGRGVTIKHLSELATLVNPSNVLLYAPDWRKHQYDLMYPDYTPSDEAVKLITAARKMGFPVMVHGNFAGMSTEHNEFKHFRRLAQVWHDGSIVVVSKIAFLNPAFSEVRNRLVQAFTEAYQRCQFDALHLDYPTFIDGLRKSGDQLSPLKGANRYLEQLTRALPGIALGGEVLNDTLMRYASLSQSGWLGEVWRKPHPIGRYLLGRYRRLYVHLGTPHQNTSPYGALLWFARLKPLGGLPTLVLDSHFDSQGNVAKIMLNAIRKRVETSDMDIAPNIVFGKTETVASNGLQGWVAQKGRRAFGLDPRGIYIRRKTPPSPASFRLIDCSVPVRVTGGTDAIRSFVHIEPDNAVLDLLKIPPLRTGVIVNGIEYPLSRGATYTRVFAACANFTRSALFTHPPFRIEQRLKQTLTFGEYSLDVPTSGKPALVGFVGLRDVPGGGTPGDGVVFTVKVNETAVWTRLLTQRCWQQMSVPLDKWRGQTVLLRLIADAGSAANTQYDWALWGEPRVVRDTTKVQVSIVDGRRPKAIVVEDATGTRLVDPTTRHHKLVIPATILHIYESQPLPPSGYLLDIPFRTYSNFAGALIVSTQPGVGNIRSEDNSSAGKRTVSGHPPFEGQTHLEWLVDLPINAKSLQFAAATKPGAKDVRFEIWINGAMKWQTTMTHPRGWVEGKVNLTREAGKPTLISLVTDSLGANHFDWAIWREPKVE